MSIPRAIDRATLEIIFRGDVKKASAEVERALAALPLDSIYGVDRPYLELGWFYELAGQPAKLRSLIASYAAMAAEKQNWASPSEQASLEGWLAMYEKRYDDAIVLFRRADWGPCTVCALPDLARAYDLSGNADSAIAVFERYLTLPVETGRLPNIDRFFLASTHKRLGELYDAKGNAAKAASSYAQFVELWKDADPELQPQVTQVRNRLRELQRAERP